MKKSQYFPFSMLSAKQGNLTSIWYQSTNVIYNVLHVHNKQQPEETKLPTHVYGQKSISQFITHKLLSSSEHFLTQTFNKRIADLNNLIVQMVVNFIQIHQTLFFITKLKTFHGVKTINREISAHNCNHSTLSIAHFGNKSLS